MGTKVTWMQKITRTGNYTPVRCLLKAVFLTGQNADLFLFLEKYRVYTKHSGAVNIFCASCENQYFLPAILDQVRAGCLPLEFPPLNGGVVLGMCAKCIQKLAPKTTLKKPNSRSKMSAKWHQHGSEMAQGALNGWDGGVI